MKTLFVWLSLSAAAFAQLPVADACSGPCRIDECAPRFVASAAKAKKGPAPATEKAPANPKPDTPRKKPALPRHLFM